MTEAQTIKILYNQLEEAVGNEFPQKGKLNITCEHGVYIVYNLNNQAAHVGRTPYGKDGLCQRLNNHLSGSSSFTRNYLNSNGKLLRDGYKFKYLVVANPRKRALLEHLATGLLCPLYLGTSEKKSI